MIRGNFIVLEGIDGSGTTTQASMIKERFDRAGLPSHVTAEPSAGPIGSQIRQILSGRLVVPRRGGTGPFDWQTLSLLFAADRHDHNNAEIIPNLNDGVTVICDRYLYSSVIYQSTSSGKEGAAEWIKSLNQYVRKPDVVFYLKVDPDEAIRRCRSRDRQQDLFEQPDFQRNLAAEYERLSEHYPDHNIVTIDGHLEIDKIAEEIWQHVDRIRNLGAPV